MGPRLTSPPRKGQEGCGDGSEAEESSPGSCCHKKKKTYISQTKQQNLIRCEVFTIQEVAVAPVRDCPSREHHDNCENNCQPNDNLPHRKTVKE